MRKQLRTIIIILGAAILPLLVYGYFQLVTLSDDEAMANKIYQKQLETVLYSLNQYADEAMGLWAAELGKRQQSIYQNAGKLVLGNEPIQLLAISKNDTDIDSLFKGEYVKEGLNPINYLQTWKQQHDSTLKRLSGYYEAGFQKIQAVEGWEQLPNLNGEQTGVTFMVYDADSVMHNILIILNTKFWVEQVLGHKMQLLAADELNVATLSLNKTGPSSVIYSTGDFEQTREFTTKKLWIFPEIALVIQPAGESYTELIRSRSRNNFYFLLFTFLALLAGIILIIKNIRNTLKVAQLKSDFVSNVSHEIRTPLSLIKMYAETLMLNRLPSEEKKKHYYNIIFHEAGRLTYLVNNILDFSRIEANKKRYEKLPLGFNELVNHCLKHYEYTFDEKQIVCKLELTHEATQIEGDHQALEEALSNIIENAIKYNNQPIELEISTFCKEDYVICVISDNGIGIPADEQSKIFDKFYRMESALTQQTKGTGLGLSLVKHIVAAHQGNITVHSKIGKGSSFELKFPLIKNEPL